MKATNLWIIISVATLRRRERFNQVWELEEGMIKCLNTLRCAPPPPQQREINIWLKWTTSYDKWMVGGQI